MKIATRPRPGARRGVTIVELALLLSIFLMFLFGAFEYCRYLFVLQVTANAARDGARYAAVNVNNATTAWQTATQDTSSPYSASRPAFNVPPVTTESTNVMGGVNQMFVSGTLRIRVYPCDPTSLYASPIVITPLSQTSTGTWNNASFGVPIACQITATFQPMFPNLLYSSQMTNISIIATTNSEG
ncbi:TadE/TadG family type IV pilus assembly protein [Fimbriiglobus ruber]|uniref:TadE-like domain-containing protein n=1 Tax=Fimbriiglobus ruber TaxID=1908690 RepID=A0A225DMP6_9BACT|nr:TadE family protein [Fimbriiglobus ruber]OWK40904.1 hypothetical protein FRUB_04796 [Fimbriiglobus ruber]